ncbi:MAG: CRISPR-associated endonuclease Cas1 [Methanospirillum sp.]|nr:CRISPR-associated endonuclease Cas1 [Methanospirillum sp.]
MKINWKIVGGFGAHIKSNRTELVIQHKGTITEIPIEDLSHFLVIGGHNIQSSALTTLIKQGVFISFCESDGEPIGYITPYEYTAFDEIRRLQESALTYSYALECAQGSIQSRILAIEKYASVHGDTILFSGEMDILSGYSQEINNMVRIEEIRRIEQLVRDMYYEIISRIIDPVYHFRRRTGGPSQDPVNAVLSFGYGMLSSACTKAIIGGHLHPSKGFLSRGKNSLVNDLVNCWKTKMIDEKAIELIQSGLLKRDTYEIGKTRCILHDKVIEKLIQAFLESVLLDVIDSQIDILVQSLNNEVPFRIIR